MQNNENHPNRRRIRNFFREKGYYIVLGLCVCAVGVSGWLFVSNAVSEKRSLQSETLVHRHERGGSGAGQQVVRR